MAIAPYRLACFGYCLSLIAAAVACGGEPPSQKQLLDPAVSMTGERPKDYSWLPKGGIDKYWHPLLSNRFKPYRIRWRPEQYFSDEQVVKLCDAITQRDVPRMRKLIAAGADVNTVGKDGMTPLYWAFHVDDDPRPFGCLLEHKANPNVICTITDRDTADIRTLGMAVVHLVSQMPYNRHFENVFRCGGDPNLKSKSDFKYNATPLLMLNPCAPDGKERLRLLAQQGVDFKIEDSLGRTYLNWWYSPSEIGRSSKKRTKKSGCIFECTVVALEHGATFKKVLFENFKRGDVSVDLYLRHLVAYSEPVSGSEDAYEQLVKWLADRGESVESAREELIELGLLLAEENDAAADGT